MKEGATSAPPQSCAPGARREASLLITSALVCPYANPSETTWSRVLELIFVVRPDATVWRILIFDVVSFLSICRRRSKAVILLYNVGFGQCYGCLPLLARQTIHCNKVYLYKKLTNNNFTLPSSLIMQFSLPRVPAYSYSIFFQSFLIIITL